MRNDKSKFKNRSFVHSWPSGLDYRPYVGYQELLFLIFTL